MSEVSRESKVTKYPYKGYALNWLAIAFFAGLVVDLIIIFSGTLMFPLKFVFLMPPALLVIGYCLG
ncbi:MAG: hypothetical protein APF81_07875 [Desulfosporosinus sp. BRH_c37]|nr:MAG: hypothetical protein APF81_07875 [Desulfosporosinus sp. BRH_c37]